MNSMQQELLSLIGWTVFHSLWLVTLIIGLAGILMKMVDHRNASVRYVIGYVGLILSFSSLFIIYFYLSQSNLVAGAKGQSLQNEVWNVPYDLVEAFDVRGESLSGVLSNYTSIIGVFWIFGTLIFSLRSATTWYYAFMLRSKDTFEVPEKWNEKLHDLSRRLGVHQVVQFRFSKRAGSPLTMGTLKPVILVPIGFFAGLSTEEVESILLHELAHIKRYDYFFNIIQRAITNVMFYHPAVWYLSNEIDKEREHACDDIAVRFSPSQISLVRALGNLQISNSKTQNKMAMYFFNNKKGTVLQRMKRLLGDSSTKNGSRYPKHSLVFGLLFLSSIILVSFNYQRDKTETTVTELKTVPELETPAAEEYTSELVTYQDTSRVKEAPEAEEVENSPEEPVAPKAVATKAIKKVEPLLSQEGLEELSEVERKELIEQKLRLEQAYRQLEKQQEMLEKEQREMLELQQELGLKRQKQAEFYQQEAQEKRIHELRLQQEKLAYAEKKAIEEMKVAEDKQEMAIKKQQIAKLRQEQIVRDQELMVLKHKLETERLSEEVARKEAFTRILIEECLKDGIIKKKSSVSVSFPDYKIHINGKVIPKNHYEKYEKIFRAHNVQIHPDHKITIEE